MIVQHEVVEIESAIKTLVIVVDCIHGLKKETNLFCSHVYIMLIIIEINIRIQHCTIHYCMGCMKKTNIKQLD